MAAGANLFPGQSPILVNAYLQAFGVRALYASGKTADPPTYIKTTRDGLLRSAPGAHVFAIWAPADIAEALHDELVALLKPQAIRDRPGWYRVTPYQAQTEIMRSVDAHKLAAITPHAEMATRVAKALAKIDREFERLRLSGGLREFNAQFKKARLAGDSKTYSIASTEFKAGILKEIANRG